MTIEPLQLSDFSPVGSLLWLVRSPLLAPALIACIAAGIRELRPEQPVVKFPIVHIPKFLFSFCILYCLMFWLFLLLKSRGGAWGSVPPDPRYDAYAMALGGLVFSGSRGRGWLVVGLFVAYVVMTCLAAYLGGALSSMQDRGWFPKSSNAGEYALSFAFLSALLLIYLVRWARSVIQRLNKSETPSGEHMVNLGVSVVVLIVALIGFKILPDRVSQLMWLICVVAGYPIVLGIIRVKDPTMRDFIRIYRIGLGQIPVVGRLLTRPGPESDQ